MPLSAVDFLIPAYAVIVDIRLALFMPIYPDPKEPYDRTGAGDAFASTLVAALASGETLNTALTWAPINSMNVSRYISAQEGLVTRDKLKELLQEAPENYHPSTQ